jgi:hypothetical protein
MTQAKLSTRVIWYDFFSFKLSIILIYLEAINYDLPSSGYKQAHEQRKKDIFGFIR